MFNEKISHANHLGNRRNSLAPFVVFSATSILTLISVIATVVSFSLCGIKEASSLVLTSLCLTLVSAAFSFIHLGLYLLAARRNEPVSKSRPPISPIHAASFIIMRLSLLLWAAATIAALVTTSGLPDCMTEGDLCLLQRIETATCVLASIVAAVIVCILENCSEPFRAPSILNIRPKITCRVSYLDEILQRSVSRLSSFDYGEENQTQKGLLETRIDQKQIKRKPVPQSPKSGAQASSCGDVTTVEFMKQGINEAIYDRTTAISAYHEKDDTPIVNACLQDITSALGDTRRAPGSSISSRSQRSPLSNMRTVDNPDLVIQPDFHFYPIRHSPLVSCTVQRPMKTLHIAHVPAAHIRSVHDQQLAALSWQTQPKYEKICLTSDRPSLCSETSVNKLGASSTIVNSFDLYQGAGNSEDVLAAHTRLIEEAIVATVQSRILDKTWLRPPFGDKDEQLAGYGEARGTGISSTLDEESKHLPELDLGSCRLWEEVERSCGNEME